MSKNGRRVFKKAIQINSLRRSPSLLNENNTEIPIDSIYHLRDVCKRNVYCAVWKKITQQYELRVNADEESEMVMHFMGRDWSEDFNFIERNLCRTTMFDDALM